MLKLAGSFDAARSEAEALRFFDGHGVARLLDAEVERRALMMERLFPGRPLSRLGNEEAATSASIAVLRALPSGLPPDDVFPRLPDRALELAGTLVPRFEAAGRPFHEQLVREAGALLDELSAPVAEQAVLHGDLHRGNVLAGRGGWVAVDPSPLLGDRAYDAGAMLRDDPEAVLAAASAVAMLRRRLDRACAELGLDRDRVRGWGQVQLVAHALERFEIRDRNRAEVFLACAQIVAAL